MFSFRPSDIGRKYEEEVSKSKDLEMQIQDLKEEILSLRKQRDEVISQKSEKLQEVELEVYLRTLYLLISSRTKD